MRNSSDFQKKKLSDTVLELIKYDPKLRCKLSTARDMIQFGNPGDAMLYHKHCLQNWTREMERKRKEQEGRVTLSHEDKNGSNEEQEEQEASREPNHCETSTQKEGKDQQFMHICHILQHLSPLYRNPKCV